MHIHTEEFVSKKKLSNERKRGRLNGYEMLGEMLNGKKDNHPHIQRPACTIARINMEQDSTE